MAFFRVLKSLLTTGERHQSEDGASDDRAVENVDAEALAATNQHLKGGVDVGGPAYPPGYVKAYDEGRPRK